MTTLPTAHDLEMWPYVADDSPLFSLAYAADVSDELPEETECYDQGIPWHEIMGWLFDLAEASYLLDIGGRELARMKFQPSPMLSLKSLDHDDRENVRVAYETLERIHGLHD